MSMLLALVLAQAVPAAATPVVANRAASPDHAGYRPADGAVVSLNPPSLVWLHEKNAASYVVQWAVAPDFANAETVTGVPFNTYTHNRTLPPGTTFWRYAYVTSGGVTSTWSKTRSFTISGDAKAFSMPSRAEQAARIPAGHPRLLMRPEDLPRLRAVAAGKVPGFEAATARFKELAAEADRLCGSEPTPEPTVRSQNSATGDRSHWWSNRLQTLKACEEAETLAMVYLMTGAEKYREAARRYVVGLARWDPEGPTNIKLNDEAAMPILHRLPRAYDWAFDALSEADRALVRQACARRGDLAYGVLRKDPHLDKPYISHNNRIWHKLAETGIACYGEPGVPNAAEWVDHAVNTFYAVYPAWADEDGGWHEGLIYVVGYVSKATWWVDAAEAALGIDCFAKPYWRHAGDFVLYLGVPGSPNVGFGDESWHAPEPEWGVFMHYLAQRTGNSMWEWWAQAVKAPPEKGALGFIRAARAVPAPTPRPPTDLPPSKVFRGVGMASLHTTLLDADDDVHFLLKASPFGRRSHGHNPHNSFCLNAFGESLLQATDYRDWQNSPFHLTWVKGTRSQNTFLVDGQGQSLNGLPLGKIADFRLEKDIDYVVGEAAAAYEGRLKVFRRSVVFAKPDVIVLYDDVVPTKPAALQVMLHSPGEFTIDEQHQRLVVDRPKAGVAIQYLPPGGALALRQWHGYDPAPSTRFPDTWHVEAATPAPVESLRLLTVLVPYRAGAAPAWTAERVDTESALGVVVHLGSRTVTVAFRTAAEGPATLNGQAVDGPFEVWRR